MPVWLSLLLAVIATGGFFATLLGAVILIVEGRRAKASPRMGVASGDRPGTLTFWATWDPEVFQVQVYRFRVFFVAPEYKQKEGMFTVTLEPPVKAPFLQPVELPPALKELLEVGVSAKDALITVEMKTIEELTIPVTLSLARLRKIYHGGKRAPSLANVNKALAADLPAVMTLDYPELQERRKKLREMEAAAKAKAAKAAAKPAPAPAASTPPAAPAAGSTPSPASAGGTPPPAGAAPAASTAPVTAPEVTVASAVDAPPAPVKEAAPAPVKEAAPAPVKEAAVVTSAPLPPPAPAAQAMAPAAPAAPVVAEKVSPPVEKTAAPAKSVPASAPRPAARPATPPPAGAKPAARPAAPPSGARPAPRPAAKPASPPPAGARPAAKPAAAPARPAAPPATKSGTKPLEGEL